jgi:hypothetical protein
VAVQEAVQDKRTSGGGVAARDDLTAGWIIDEFERKVSDPLAIVGGECIESL